MRDEHVHFRGDTLTIYQLGTLRSAGEILISIWKPYESRADAMDSGPCSDNAVFGTIRSGTRLLLEHGNETAMRISFNRLRLIALTGN